MNWEIETPNETTKIIKTIIPIQKSTRVWNRIAQRNTSKNENNYNKTVQWKNSNIEMIETYMNDMKRKATMLKRHN